VPFQIFAYRHQRKLTRRARAGIYIRPPRWWTSRPNACGAFSSSSTGDIRSTSPSEDVHFCAQNVAKDPPFSNLDLISCRNLLIYLGAVLQKRVIPTLHYALKPDRYLMLADPRVSGPCGVFLAARQEDRIFRRKIVSRLSTYFNAVEYGIRRIENTKVAREPETVFQCRKGSRRVLFMFRSRQHCVNEEMELCIFEERLGPIWSPLGPSDIPI